jgi:hypothetical protein
MTNELYNWRTLAAQRFTGATVYSTGRYAVRSCDGKAIWLCPTAENAKCVSMGGCCLGIRCRAEHAVFDLLQKPTPVPNIRDDYEDKMWERKQSRT